MSCYVPKGDSRIQRLTAMHRLQGRAWRRGLDCSTIDEKIQQAQADIDRIRSEIWCRHWAIPYTVGVHRAQART
jgi:hypothetical protein